MMGLGDGSSGWGGGCSGDIFRIARSRSTRSPVSTQYLPLFSLTDEVEEVNHLLHLDIFPGCFQDRLLQAGEALFDSSTAGAANQDHDVAKDASTTLLNERGLSGLATTRQS